MKIQAIELRHIAMPLKEIWRTACSEETAIQAVVVRMIADGHEGWAETSPHRGPLYSPEWAAGVFHCLRDWLGPMALGRNIENGNALQELLRPVKGNHFAKAGLDIAWWDAYGKSLGQPVWKLIGGTRRTVEVGADLGVREKIDDLLEDVHQAAEAGFRRVKLKFRPGWDLDMIAAVRQAFPNLKIHVDCNSGYRLDDVALFKKLDDYDLAMIEQPLAHDDLMDHAALQSQIETPICLDESIVSLDRARHALALGSCRWINIKVGRTGGITNAVAIHDFCHAEGIPCWVGNMLESALGQSPALALATLPNMRYPSDVFPSTRFYSEDMSVPPLELSAPSEMTAPDTPGLGRAPDPRRLDRFTVQSARVEAG